MDQDLLARLKRHEVLEALRAGERVDGRDFEEFRPIELRTDVISKANGSALIHLGNTQLVVGVKLEVGTPYPDTPDEGALAVNAELVPLADPTFEPGPPDENAIELSRVVDRGIRESEMINLKSLCIQEGEHCWVTFVDIHVLDHDGNLFDASLLASVAALHRTRVPRAEVVDDEVEVDETETTPLEVRDFPVSVTLALVDEHLLVDPCLDEEVVMDARITVTVTEEGRICAVQKGERGSLPEHLLDDAIDLAVKKAEEIRRVAKAQL
ncbi:MAG: exosome complex protein Rrp42 [Euryarchaeota archaeon]